MSGGMPAAAAGAAVLRMLRAWANRDNQELPLPTYETIPGATPAQVCGWLKVGRSWSGCAPVAAASV